jgi:hypothetical protein
MKKTIITAVLFFEALIVIAQPIITNSKVTVGKNLITGNEILATKYEFQDKIYNYQLDTTFQTLTLQLRGIKSNGKYYKNTGDLAVFDLKSKEIRWSKEINYGSSEINQYDNILLLNTGLNSTTRIELTTGNSLWESDIVVFATIPNLNILLGYKYNSFMQEFSKKLSCIELTTGNLLWERPVDRSYGWYGIENLNDTALIIKSSGLCHVNLKTGRGWNYDAKTGMKDYSKTVGANVAGAVLGLLTGSFVVSTGHDLVSNLVSNLTTDSLNLYFASKDYLTCLSHEGVVKWKVALPKETSHSNLILDSTRVILINVGEAEYNGKRCNYGKPYIAVFDIKSGTQQYLSIFDLDKNPLLEFIGSKDSIDLFFKDRAIQYSLKNGSFTTTNYDSEQIGNFEYTVGMFRTYIKSDSTFQSLHSLDPRAMYLMSNKNKVVKINRNLGFDKNIALDELYSWRAESNKYTFLYHDNKVFVINNLNKVIAELNIGKKIFILDNKLYEIDGNTINEIDLDRNF